MKWNVDVSIYKGLSKNKHSKSTDNFCIGVAAAHLKAVLLLVTLEIPTRDHTIVIFHMRL